MVRFPTVRRVLGPIVLCGLLATPEDARGDPPRPRGGYVPVSPTEPFDVGARRVRTLSHPGAPWTLFLNRDGGRYAPGPEDSSANLSSIVGEVVDVPPYPYSDESWNDVMRCMREIYAPFRISITDVDPGAAPHMECVVTTTDEAAGFAWTTGVAPYDWESCTIFPTGISFVFAQVIGDSPRDICETAGQESAHVFGLDHVVECTDLMTYASGCGEKRFVDEWVACGEDAPRVCACGGATQNSYQALLGILGPHVPSDPPTVTITSPEDGALVLLGFSVVTDAVDDGAVEGVELRVDGELRAIDHDPPFEFDAVEDVEPGEHVLAVEAFDSEEQSAEDTVTVVVAECGGESPCGAGERCVDGFCEADDGGGWIDGDDGADEGGGGGSGAASCGCSTSSGRLPFGWIVLAVAALRTRRGRQDPRP